MASSADSMQDKKSVSDFTQTDLKARIQRSNSISSVIWVGKKVLPPELVNKQIIEQIASILKTDPSIKSLKLSSSSIKSPADQAVILDAACYAANLKHVELYNIDFDNIPNTIMERLYKLPLTSITIFNEDLCPSDQVLVNIIEQIAQNKSISVLELHGLSLTNIVVQKMIPVTYQLKRMVLENTKVSSKSIALLISKSSLEEIYVNESGSEPQTADIPNEISTAILQSKTLMYFQLPFVLGNPFALDDNHIIKKSLDEKRTTQYDRNKIAYIQHGDLALFNNMHMHPDLAVIFNAVNKKDSSEMLALMQSTGFSLTACRSSSYYVRNPYLHELVANELYQKFLVQLIHGASNAINPHEFDYEGKDLLILAAKTYSADEVFLTVLKTYKNMLNIQARDDKGCTAIHYLCAYGKFDLLKELFSLMKNNIELRNFQGKTPLDYCNLSQKEAEEILESIDINPKRDANVCQNNLLGALKYFDKKFEVRMQNGLWGFANESVATLESFNQLRERVLALTNSEERKETSQYFEVLATHFAGKSVIDKIMESKAVAKKVLEDYIKSDATLISNTLTATAVAPTVLISYEMQAKQTGSATGTTSPNSIVSASAATNAPDTGAAAVSANGSPPLPEKLIYKL